MSEANEYEVVDEWDRRFRSTVERSSDDEFAHGVVRDKHELKVDEPEWLEEPGSGEDAHPAPVDYMVFGLVSCQV